MKRNSLLAPDLAIPFALSALAVVILLDPAIGAVLAFSLAAIVVYRSSIWLAAVSAVWALVFLAVLTVPGPYDSWAGRAAVPVLAIYAGCFLAAWALARRWTLRTPAASGPPAIRWPRELWLRLFLAALLATGIVAAVLRFQGTVPPLFADNPDVAREVLRQHANIEIGLLSQAWTVGLAVSLFRTLAGEARGRWLYAGFAVAFLAGSALGASKNSVLIGVVPGLIAAMSLRRSQPRRESKVNRKIVAIIAMGALAVGLAVFLGGQRTLAGTGTFEDQFRARYGGNAVATSVGSLDLSLSASAETFGRLWAQREYQSPAAGRYSLMFTGSPGQGLVGAYSEDDFYRITAQLSEPFYMNTATFVAIPLLDYGPVGAGIFLVLLGMCVGLVEARMERSADPARQLGRAFVIYFAAFGIYELYPFVQPFWLGIAPGLVCLSLLARRRAEGTPIE